MVTTSPDPSASGPLPSPLAGLKVLDFTRVVAGPFATRMMADLGADVVKVEPPDGDITRIWGEERGGQSGFYVQQNAGKRNICVDLRAAGATELLRSMVEAADIVVENFRPGIMARYGLDYETLRSINPRVIMLSVSGFGQTSSHAGRAAFAPVLHAESGLLARQAFFDGVAPVDPVLSIADTNAALHGLVAVLAALHLRSTTGTGQHVDLAMLNAMTVTDDYAHNALDAARPFRLGGEVWKTGFGHMLIAANAKVLWFMLRQGDRLDDGLGPDAPVDTKAATRQQLMADWFESFVDRDTLIAELDDLNIAWGDVLAPGDVFDTEVAHEQRLSTHVDDRAGNTRRVTESPYHFSHAVSRVAGAAPHRGEHHMEVLAEWIGYEPDQVVALEASRILLLDAHAMAKRAASPTDGEER